MQDAGRMREVLCFAFALYVFFGLKSVPQLHAAPTSWSIHYRLSNESVTDALDRYLQLTSVSENRGDWARVMGTEP